MTMKQTKILFLIDSLGSGGAQRQITTIACLLKGRGYDVSFLCYHHDDFFKPILDRNNIRVNVVEYKNNVEKIFKLWKAVGRSCCDVVISMLSSPNLYALLTGIGRKHKVITGLRGMPQLSGGNYSKDARFEWRADYMVSNSQNAVNVWLQTYPNHKNKFKVIYNAVSLGKIDSTYELRRDGCTHIVVAATCYDVKNPRGLVEALHLMNETDRRRICIEWYGVVSGMAKIDREVSDVEKLVKEYGLENTIHFFPTSPNIANIMNEADAVALFSHGEGLPNAICEAMLIGKPIVMTRVSDFETLVDGNGFLCDSKDYMSIKDAILNLANLSDEELRAMGRVSHDKAKQLFSEESVANQWVSVIEN